MRINNSQIDALLLQPPSIEEKFNTLFDAKTSAALGYLLLELGVSLLERGNYAARLERNKDMLCLMHRKQTLVKRIDDAIERIERMVNTGATLRHAVKSAAESYNISEATLYEAVHFRAPVRRSLRRVEIDRLIDAGWPDCRIGEYLKVHRSTILRHRKARLSLGNAIERDSGSTNTKNNTDRA